MIYWIWLSQIKGIGIQLQKALLSHFKDPRHIYFASKNELMQVMDFGCSRTEYILNNKSLGKAAFILNQCEKNQIHIMTLQHVMYPILRMQKKYGKCRFCSIIKESQEQTIALAYRLAGQGIPVISGMAKGIDAYAHTACLKAGGYTAPYWGTGLISVIPVNISCLCSE